MSENNHNLSEEKNTEKKEIKKVFCELCNKHIAYNNLQRHLKTKKHLDNVPKTNQNVEELVHYNCKYCGRKFKHQQGKSRHELYRCKKRPDKPEEEIIEEIIDEDEVVVEKKSENQEINELKDIISRMNMRMDSLQCQLDNINYFLFNMRDILKHS